MEKPKKTKAITVAPTQQMTEAERPYQINAEVLIASGIEKGVPVETMERLLAMRKELKAEWAKEQYDLAMATLQGELPEIKKSTDVKDKNDKKRYGYAKLEHIVAQTKEPISRNGFSYKTEIENDDKFLTARCIVTHKFGHVEVSTFTVPISNEDHMTEVQKFGARSTFAKRYAFCNAFGIITADNDVDGDVKGKAKPKPTSVDEIKEMIRESIRTQKDTSKIMSVMESTQQSEKFDEEFKSEISKMASNRIDELSNQG